MVIQKSKGRSNKRSEADVIMDYILKVIFDKKHLEIMQAEKQQNLKAQVFSPDFKARNLC